MTRDQFNQTAEVISRIKTEVIQMLPPSTVHEVAKRYEVTRLTVKKVLDDEYQKQPVGRKPKTLSSAELVERMAEDIQLKTIDEYVNQFRLILERIDELN